MDKRQTVEDHPRRIIRFQGGHQRAPVLHDRRRVTARRGIRHDVDPRCLTEIMLGPAAGESAGHADLVAEPGQ